MAKRKAPSRKRRTKRASRRGLATGSKTPRKRPARASRTKTARPARRRSVAARRKVTTRRRATRPAATLPRKPTSRRPRARASTPPALARERRALHEEPSVVPTPPSSLDLDRHASEARIGGPATTARIGRQTETGPALTGRDVDTDRESAYSTGVEAPGGDNPTPDQDGIDEIGRAIGVQEEDGEHLKGAAKIAERDRRRWERDPASSEDYRGRRKT